MLRLAFTFNIILVMFSSQGQQVKDTLNIYIGTSLMDNIVEIGPYESFGPLYLETKFHKSINGKIDSLNCDSCINVTYYVNLRNADLGIKKDDVLLIMTSPEAQSYTTVEKILDDNKNKSNEELFYSETSYMCSIPHYPALNNEKEWIIELDEFQDFSHSKKQMALVKQKVNFKKLKAEIIPSEETTRMLNTLSNLVSNYSKLKIKIEGNAFSMSNDWKEKVEKSGESLEALALKRGEAVKDFLVKEYNIPEEIISYSRGQLIPLETGKSASIRLEF